MYSIPRGTFRRRCRLAGLFTDFLCEQLAGTCHTYRTVRLQAYTKGSISYEPLYPL